MLRTLAKAAFWLYQACGLAMAVEIVRHDPERFLSPLRTFANPTALLGLAGFALIGGALYLAWRVFARMFNR